MAIPYVACMVIAAQIYALPPRVLPAIQVVEGGKNGMVSYNVNRSADLGVMQVNTRWIPALASYAGITETMVRDRLINQPCFNIAASAAIMRIYLNEAHDDLMLAIGYYHSHTGTLNRQYQLKVLRAATTLFSGSVPSP